MATTTTNLGLIKPAGTDKIRIANINQNMDTLDEKIGPVGNTSLQAQATAHANTLSAMESGIAILANGNTHAAISSGDFVYVKNHGTLAEGMYIATAAIAANGTLSTSNLSSASSGGLNALQSSTNQALSNVNNKIPAFQTHVTYTYSGGSVTDWNVAIEQWIDSLSTSNMIQIGTVQISGSGVRMAIVQKFNENYVSAIAFGYWTANVTYYRKVDDVWSFSILAQKSDIENAFYEVTYDTTTSSTGAVNISANEQGHIYLGAVMITGGPGFVFRRDSGYLTVFNNSMQPIANTAVKFKAYYTTKGGFTY